jgi:hypothetical protein
MKNRKYSVAALGVALFIAGGGVAIAAADPQPVVYLDTNLTACPKGQKLSYFFYYRDIPQERGSTWCGAAAADVAYANATDPVTWRIPYVLESCQAGVAWYYSHAFYDGNRYYSPAYRGINLVCVPDTCAVPPLTPISDAVALQHEDGQYAAAPDMEHVSDGVKSGAACIVQKAAGYGARARPTSGFRPPAYQAHLREVWDKWQLLKVDDTEGCRDTKNQVQAEWLRHGLVRQPVVNSNHSAGNAVDVAGVPNSSADLIAGQCGMFRPEPTNDKVHFQVR